VQVHRKIPKSGRSLAARLEASILSGKLPPGSKLPGEKSLAQAHDLSRAAVREALETLKARGLITSRRGSGSYVAVDAGSAALSASVGVYAALRRDLDTYRQLMMLRMFIECECIGVLAGKDRWRSRERLRAALAGMAGKRASLAAFGKADLAFHLALVEESGHKLYATLLRGLLRGIGGKYARETYVERSFVDTVLAEHRAICEALDLGRAGGARRALQRHLHHSLQRLEGLLFR
jgi:GntR family transcriptional regulator, transcriptional repressor for pyruvate dehydrogenase complex